MYSYLAMSWAVQSIFQSREPNKEKRLSRTDQTVLSWRIQNTCICIHRYADWKKKKTNTTWVGRRTLEFDIHAEIRGEMIYTTNEMFNWNKRNTSELMAVWKPSGQKVKRRSRPVNLARRELLNRRQWNAYLIRTETVQTRKIISVFNTQHVGIEHVRIWQHV